MSGALFDGNSTATNITVEVRKSEKFDTVSYIIILLVLVSATNISHHVSIVAVSFMIKGCRHDVHSKTRICCIGYVGIGRSGSQCCRVCRERRSTEGRPPRAGAAGHDLIRWRERDKTSGVQGRLMRIGPFPTIFLYTKCTGPFPMLT